jgi:chromosome segregation protein SMC, common bacterial type
MYLKSVELLGFKSFPDKTILEFPLGMSAVVGPNGSGKSNISDAILWVMGEASAKALRGGKMEDVVFSGTPTRKGHGFAQVTLTFLGATEFFGYPDDVLSVTRKYFRSGESEYMINGQNVRLRDINELFMDTGLGRDGYAMIGQGRIAEIVGAKSSERREIFEQAAGIAKFRYRRHGAQRELDIAEENLVRLRDIHAELSARVGPLKTQSEKAKKYLVLAEQKKTLELAIMLKSLDRRRQDTKDQDDKIFLSAEQEKSFKSAEERLETEIESFTQKESQIKLDLDGIRDKRENLDGERSSISQKIAVLQNESEHCDAEKLRISEEIEKLSMSGDDFAKKKAERAGKIAEINDAISKQQEKAAAAEAELLSFTETSDGAVSELERVRGEIAGKTLLKTKADLTAQGANANAEALRAKLSDLNESITYKKAERETLVKQKNDAAAELETQQEKKQSIENSLGGYRLKLSTRKESLSALAAKLADYESKTQKLIARRTALSDLEKNNEGVSYAAKSVMSAASGGRLSGVHGSVGQLIDVPADYSTAIEIALASAIGNIVVAGESDAKRAIAFLRDTNAGRATFMPMSAIKPNVLDLKGFAGLSDHRAFVGLACDLIDCDDKYRDIVENLLGKTVVADDLESASEIAKKYGYRFKIVSLDGQVINAGGSFTGGSRGKSTGVLSRKGEIAKLSEQLESMKVAAGPLKEEYEKAQATAAELEAYLRGAESEIITANENIIRAEAEFKSVSARVADIDGIISAFEKELSDAESGIKAEEEKEVTSRKEESDYSALLGELEQKLSSLSADNAEFESMRTGLSDALSEARVALSKLQSELVTEQFLLAELDKSGGEREQQKALFSEQIAAADKKKEEIAQQISEETEKRDNFVVDYSEFDEKIAALRQESIDIEGEIVKRRGEIREISKNLADVAAEIARLSEQKNSITRDSETIIANMWEEYGITPPEAAFVADEIGALSQAQKELTALKNKIKSLGSINIDAIEEYKQVGARFETLNSQLEDIESSKAQLLKLISELTADMRKIFIDAFTGINQKFGEIFTSLFGGGSANLRLADPENPLECGIEINVSPPGKIIKNLSSLSGGEQAFVAIAIYFAILKTRPSPFCVLDEIEAALDDVNVNKFAAYLKTMADKTQFIVITHRRGTMEAADVLYGVTMQNEGESKLLRLNSAPDDLA